jgi:hypothetical protein
MSQIPGENTPLFAVSTSVLLFFQRCSQPFLASEKRSLSRNRHAANHRANKIVHVMEVPAILKTLGSKLILLMFSSQPMSRRQISSRNRCSFQRNLGSLHLADPRRSLVVIPTRNGDSPNYLFCAKMRLADFLSS